VIGPHSGPYRTADRADRELTRLMTKVGNGLPNPESISIKHHSSEVPHVAKCP